MAKKKNNKNKSKVLKTKTTSPPITNNFNSEIIAAALATINQPILLKVCRLCETKDGPFLHIFDSEKVIAKKIDELMPFWVAENDDLPHKICFRCSAKVEEFHEFVQKCINTQNNLRKTIGKKEPLPAKSKTRDLWEQKLNESNMSNDDICDALIKKAMESIQNVVPTFVPFDDSNSNKAITQCSKVNEAKHDSNNQEDLSNDKSEEEISLKNDRSVNGKSGLPKLSTVETSHDEKESEEIKSTQTNTVNDANKYIVDSAIKHVETDKHDDAVDKQNNVINKEPEANSKPFDIMDHVSMIKVNGVGVLFQCKLCNRNFLKKEVVLSHGCAKARVPKVNISNTYRPPDPPKVTSVKYINTRLDKNNGNTIVQENQKSTEIEKINPSGVATTVKKKVGPASKIGRRSETCTASETQNSSNESIVNPMTSNIEQMSNNPSPVVTFPAAPSTATRYKLVPGPNNVFCLVEDKKYPDDSDSQNTIDKPKCKSPEIIDLEDSPVENKSVRNNKNLRKHNPSSKTAINSVANIENQTGQPYPVGLFQTVSHHSNNFNSTPREEVQLTSPAVKKQSYTVVQTGNPSKLLISTKPQPAAEDISKKRPRKTKTLVNNTDKSLEPYSVILEDASHPKDTGFFTFINVDPLLQPSYVLPTDNIIQESQISTSTPLANKDTETKDSDKNKYVCNMCGDKFNREKKLNAHIYSHYNRDEEDNSGDERPLRKRTRK
ncbi:uncharacterized protein [Battus philenor]|uniref:uncharacterized protein n=1 Tax=Battus philenor TaxID=42288 RepID=UPI0035D01D5F